MYSDMLNPLLAMGQTPAAGQTPAPWYFQMVPFVVLIVVFYVAMIRPQQKKAKEHARLMSNLKSGDEVVTSGGVLGTVITVKDRSVTLRTADSKMELLKSAIAEVTNRDNNSKS
jgi:preprotein translocase subunit YajC